MDSCFVSCYFIRFLKERGLYSIFYRNFNDCNPVIDLRNFLRSNNIHDWVDNAFCWRETVEGHDFWDDVDTQWRKEYSNIYHGHFS